MEIAFALWLWLASGETQIIYGDQATCQHVEQSITGGEIADLESESGAISRVLRAVCMGPAMVDPCEMEGLS